MRIDGLHTNSQGRSSRVAVCSSQSAVSEGGRAVQLLALQVRSSNRSSGSAPGVGGVRRLRQEKGGADLRGRPSLLRR